MMQPRLKHFGWGREGEGLTSAEETFVFERIEQRFGPLADGEVKPPRLEDLTLQSPRLNPPASLSFCSTALYDRAAHTYGKSFPDYVRGLVGDYSSAPDVVAYPRTEEEIVAVLDWAGGAQASVTPFGGGSSVVGGVEPRRVDRASSAGLSHAATRRDTRRRSPSTSASLAVYWRLTRP